MRRRGPSRVLLRVLSIFGLVFALVFTAVTAWSLADEARGAKAVAEVRDVAHRGSKTYLRVRFATVRGPACESSLRVVVDANRSVRPGGSVRVRHARTIPACGYVEDVSGVRRRRIRRVPGGPARHRTLVMIQEGTAAISDADRRDDDRAA